MSPRTMLSAVVLSLVAGLVPGRSGYAVERYVADATHSSTVFRTKHMNTSNAWGRFNEIAGSFTLDETNPSESQFEFQVKASSIDTANDKRDQHLKSPDFLNAVQFPDITFKSQTVTRSGDAYEVTGDLTLHGVTKPISVRVVPTGKGKTMLGTPTAGIEATFNIKRSEFGMNKMIGPVGDDVWINVSIEGVRK